MEYILLILIALQDTGTSVLEFLNYYGGAITAIATVILAIVTFFYVRLTRRMLLEMKATNDPSVQVAIEFPEKLANVSISNTGQSPAVNIKFTVEDNAPWQRVRQNKKWSLNSLSIFQTGISCLPSQQCLKFGCHSILDWKKIADVGGTIRITTCYENEVGKSFEREIFIDLSAYQDVLFESFRDPIADELRYTRRQQERTAYRSVNTIRAFRRPKKLCPMCSKSIPKEAKKCPKCHEFIEENPASQKKGKSKNS